MAYLVGVGAAIAVGGAVFGTLLGQIRGAAEPFNLTDPANSLGGMLEGLVILVGAVGTLVYFQFSANDPPRSTSPPRAGGRRPGPGRAGLHRNHPRRALRRCLCRRDHRAG